MHKEIWTIGRILRWTDSTFKARRWIHLDLMGKYCFLPFFRQRIGIYLYTHYDQPLIQEELDAFQTSRSKRAKGHCVAAIGEKDFMGLTFKG